MVDLNAALSGPQASRNVCDKVKPTTSIAMHYIRLKTGPRATRSKRIGFTKFSRTLLASNRKLGLKGRGSSVTK